MTGFLPVRILPVLMYHRLGEANQSDPSLFISQSSFSRQLLWLNEQGYETLSIDRALDLWTRGRAPKHSILITFDDAFADTLSVAARALTQAGMRATVFAPAGLLGQEVELRSPSSGSNAVSQGRIASEQELKAWAEKGFDVGSHSLSHPDLTEVSPVRVLDEAQDSKLRLEEILERPIEDFCYPYTHHNSSCRRLVQRSGYRSAFAGEPPMHDLYAIPRMMIYPHDSMARFRRKVSGFYYWISAWHRRLLRTSRQPTEIPSR
jgi:peptidoglycan/xylan/chitin deacetylase (PgdA/CDA1 family)